MTTDTVELRGGKYVVLSQAGEVLGEFGSESEARERLRQIEAAKAAKDEAVPRGTLEEEVIGANLRATIDRERDKADEEPRVEVGVRRYDKGHVRKKARYDASTGFLHVDAAVTRAPAVFDYRNADGSLRREFRPADHVFSKDNLDRIGKSTVTLGHPPVRVTSKNVRRFGVGHADGNARVEKDHAIVGLVINDDEAIAAVKAGKRDMSCGYDCDLIFKAGVFTDSHGVPHHYDAIQTNHRNNHHAIVDSGRAGSAQLFVDRRDAVQVTEEDNMADKEKEDGQREDLLFSMGDDKTKGRVKVDGVDIEMPIEQARMVAKSQRDAKAKADTLEAERDAAKSDLDAANEKLANTKTEEEIQERVDARRELLDKASAFIVDEAAFEAIKSKTDDEIKRACIAAVNPSIVLDEKPEAYVEAMFDLLKPERDDNMSRTGRTLLGAKSKDSEGHDLLKKRIYDSIEKTDDAYCRAIPGGMTVDGKTGARDDVLHG